MTLELVTEQPGLIDALIVVVPVGIIVAVAGVVLYLIKKRDRQRARIVEAHRPRTQGRVRPSDDDPPT